MEREAVIKWRTSDVVNAVIHSMVQESTQGETNSKNRKVSNRRWSTRKIALLTKSTGTIVAFRIPGCARHDDVYVLIDRSIDGVPRQPHVMYHSRNPDAIRLDTWTLLSFVVVCSHTVNPRR